MDTSTLTHEKYKGVSKDPVYKLQIGDLKRYMRYYDGKQRGEKIKDLQIDCLRQFEIFNNVKKINRFFSLYDLCQNEDNRKRASKGKYTRGGSRTCFVDKDGNLSIVFLHIKKIELDTGRFYRIAVKLDLNVNFVSDFRDPLLYTGACFTRKEDKSKGVINDKEGGVFRKLSEALNTDIL
ncbi:unnamed protein product [marine sediment metagenome]|uniref:Uncharacterized protein n=1 Tax=marine sediment metagenome TaxID=412755 RepID=X1T454_9ZZZZ